MSQYFRELLKEYHSSAREFTLKKSKKNQEKYIALTLTLSQYYYEHNEMDKAKHHLHELLLLDEDIENVNLYLGLISLYESNNIEAIKYLEEEVELFPKNNYAQDLLEKVSLSSSFPWLSIVLGLLLLGAMFFLGGTLNLTSLFTWGLHTNSPSLLQGVSSIFIHTSWSHLISNLLILLLFGHLLEKYFGPMKYLSIFLCSAVFGNLAQIILFPEVQGYVVGASAGMFGIMGALLIRNPILETKLFGIIKVPLIVILGIIFSLSIIIPTSLFQSAEVAHVCGLFIGIFLGGLFYRKNISVFYNWIFVAFGLLLWTLGAREILLNSSLMSILISILISVVGLSLAIFGYSLLEKTMLKRGVRDE